jgi:hypothetical protein
LTYSTWLVLDADDSARPFLSTLQAKAVGPSKVPSGAVSPAARSAEKLTELTNTSTAAAAQAARKASASSNVRAQASKFDAANAEAKDGVNGLDKDRRASLQHAASHASTSAGTTGSIGRRSFMSRLRGAGGSVSSASVFQAQGQAGTEDAASVSASGSWSIVDNPAPIKEEGQDVSAARKVVFAYSPMATSSAVQQASGLVARSSAMLSPSPEDQIVEQVHSDRVDAASIAALAQTQRADAIFVGSAQSSTSSDQLFAFLQALVDASSAPVKRILVEPATVRRLSTEQAAALFDAARTRRVQLSLPVRWTSMSSINVDETMQALELLQEVEGEQAQRAQSVGDGEEADVSGNFDVSLSNIPTGLSSDKLDESTELETAKAQVAQLERDLQNKDRRIAELVRQAEALAAENKAAKAASELAPIPATAAAAEETTARSNAGTSAPAHPATVSASAVAAGTSAELLKPADEQAPSTPHTPVRTPIARQLDSNAAATPMSTPVPSSSRNLAAAVGSRTSSPHGAVAAALGAAAAITGSPGSPSGGARSSGKVIATLTAELSETRTILDATRAALATVRTQSAAYQAQADEMRGTLSRARLENDSSVGILARKDRQIVEALERARKAEAEAKELGRAGREWGTRVREVEDELGKERIKRSRAEQAYEALSSEWKSARERLRAEVDELRTSHAEQVQALAKEYDTLLAFKTRLQDHANVTIETGNTDFGAQALVKDLERVNADMQTYLTTQVQPLVDRMAMLEQRENAQIVDRITLLTDELTRIKTLMRRGDITSPDQIAPSTL